MLQDGIGNCHQVEFNKILTTPILTTGWHQFRDFYHITMNPLMSFTYLGDSVFQIKIFNGSTPKNEYPRYHRLTTCITRDLTFQLTVPENSIISSKFVSLFIFIFTFVILLITISILIYSINISLFYII